MADPSSDDHSLRLATASPPRHAWVYSAVRAFKPEGSHEACQQQQQLPTGWAAQHRSRRRQGSARARPLAVGELAVAQDHRALA